MDAPAWNNELMTERKPPEVSFESWIDKQIREAEERGDFATLKGRGKPLPDGLNTTSHDEQWWIKQKMARTWRERHPDRR